MGKMGTPPFGGTDGPNIRKKHKTFDVIDCFQEALYHQKPILELKLDAKLPFSRPMMPIVLSCLHRTSPLQRHRTGSRRWWRYLGWGGYGEFRLTHGMVWSRGKSTAPLRRSHRARSKHEMMVLGRCAVRLCSRTPLGHCPTIA